MKVSPASTVPWSGRLNERVRADITQARRFDTIAIIRACRRDGKTTWPCASSDAIHPQKAAARNWRNSGLGIDGRSTHNSPMNKLCYERADYSVVVKNRAPPPKAWRWEIYRGRQGNMPTFVYMTRCDGCGQCVDICPSDIMHIDTTYRRAFNIEPNMCWECYACVK